MTLVSASSFDSTVARLERAAVANGLTVAAKIDHAAAARKAGLTLRPTTLIIAGNPAAGTPLMLADQTIGGRASAAISRLAGRGWEDPRLVRPHQIDRGTPQAHRSRAAADEDDGRDRADRR
jgi:hypothetical protein